MGNANAIFGRFFVALSDDYGFEPVRTGPKSFTEYSFSALMVFVAQIGSLICALAQVSLFGPLSIFLSYLFPLGGINAGVVFLLSAAVIFSGIYQVYLVYKLHTQGLGEQNRIITVNYFSIIAEVVLLVLSVIIFSFFALFVLQPSVFLIILNIASIYFLKDRKIQNEFGRLVE